MCWHRQNSVAENKIVIFSKTWCPYCRRAKTLLTSKFPKAQTKILECVSLAFYLSECAADALRLAFRLDELQEGDAIQNYLREKTGQHTVPNIFISE